MWNTGGGVHRLARLKPQARPVPPAYGGVAPGHCALMWVCSFHWARRQADGIALKQPDRPARVAAKAVRHRLCICEVFKQSHPPPKYGTPFSRMTPRLPDGALPAGGHYLAAGVCSMPRHFSKKACSSATSFSLLHPPSRAASQSVNQSATPPGQTGARLSTQVPAPTWHDSCAWYHMLEEWAPGPLWPCVMMGACARVGFLGFFFRGSQVQGVPLHGA